MKLILPLLLVLVFLASCSPEKKLEKNCEQIRAAFDIGSGTTKMRVAKVDLCQKKLLDVMLYTDQFVAFKDDLQKSKNFSFSEAMIEKGINAVQTLKSKAVELGAVSFTGVATSAFRSAKNGTEAVKRITSSSGVVIRIIDQIEEGELAFKAAQMATTKDPKKMIVWDSGGGSTQLIYLDENNKLQVYEGKVGSISFKNHIITVLQKKQLAKVQSPNPIGEALDPAIEDARVIAKFSVPDKIKQLLLDPQTQVVGIGGLHVHSIQDQVKPKATSYSQFDVKYSLMQKYRFGDEKMTGEYASTDVSNLILILGFMQELKIQTIYTLGVNLTVPLLVE